MDRKWLWLFWAAKIEDESPSISVGGMAHDLGMLGRCDICNTPLREGEKSTCEVCLKNNDTPMHNQD